MSPASAKRAEWYRAQRDDVTDLLRDTEGLTRAERTQLLVLAGILNGLSEHAEDTEALRADVAEIKARIEKADTIVSRGDVLKLLGAATLASVVTVVSGAAEWLRKAIMGG